MSGEASEQSVPAPKSNMELFVDLLKATYLPLLVGIGCFAGLLYIWIADVTFPYRTAALIVMTTFVGGPFVAAYTMLAAYWLDRQSRKPVLIVDEDHEAIAQLDFTPTEFGKVEVDGSLATRRSSAGTVYVAEEHRVEERERLDPETDEKETVAQRVLAGTWEGEVSSLAFLEARSVLEEQRKRLVPLAKDAIDVRAATDEKVLDGVVSSAHGLLAGAEQDEFFDDTADPLDLDLDVDKDELDDVVGDPVEDDADQDDADGFDVQLVENETEPEVPADDD